jgi:hypothetical protein
MALRVPSLHPIIKSMIMKKLTIMLLMTSSLSWGALDDHLEKRGTNYQILKKHYSSLLSDVADERPHMFCEKVYGIIPTLNQIFMDDQDLISDLRRRSESYFIDYAIHLEDNSFSPLFSANTYKELCLHDNHALILNLSRALTYHITNVDYLKMHHDLWSSTFGPFSH